MTDTFIKNPLIGKITEMELNKTSTTGKTKNHILNGFVLDPFTGKEIMIRIVVPTEAKRFDPKTRKFVLDDKAALKGQIYLKGFRNKDAYKNRTFTVLDVENPITLEKDQIVEPATSIKVAKKVIEVSDSDNPF
jgi:hypothetical protein